MILNHGVSSDAHADCPICQSLLADGTGRLTTLREELERRGFRPRPADALPPEGVARALRKLIGELARLQVYLLETDHLTDIELYRLLVDELLDRQEVRAPEQLAYYALASAEDFWRYYADDEAREALRRQQPDAPLPPREALKANRDSKLPGP